MSALVGLVGSQEEGKEESLWKGFSRFQVPHSVMKYRGTAPSQVYLLVFRLGCSASYHAKRVQKLTVSKSQSYMMRQTKLSRRAVISAIETLEHDGLLAVIPREQQAAGRKASGTFVKNILVLLHPETREPLLTMPGSYSVCYRNTVRPYLTVPRVQEERLHGMQRSGRAVGLSALSEASSCQSLSFGVRKSDLRKKSGLGRNHFELGLSECERERLLTYAKNIVTMLDPLTGKEPNRQPREFIKHEDTNWKFDLDKVTADQWRSVVTRLMPYREFFEGADGWTFTTGHLCPFCKAERAFAVNFRQAQYRCHEDKTDRCSGRLAQLVRRLLRCNMAETKEYIQEIIGQKTPEAETQAASMLC